MLECRCNRLHGSGLTQLGTAVQRLSGAEIIAEFLVRAGVTHAAGIPGHGVWTLTDALLDRPEIRTVQVMHEQSAVHLADGYYRASGKPMLAFTSIGPGATNTVIGMATAYVDSTAVALFTGSTHTYMRGHGVLQELERRHHADNPRIFEPVVKEWWQPSRVDELGFVLHRAWNAMTSGRPGPILMDVPMDIQAEAAEVVVPEPDARRGPWPAASRRGRGRTRRGAAGRSEATGDRGRRRRDHAPRRPPSCGRWPSGLVRRSSPPGTVRGRSTRRTRWPARRSATPAPRSATRWPPRPTSS